MQSRTSPVKHRRFSLALALDPSRKNPLFLQIAQAILKDLRRGRLRPGSALPGTRTLAASLGVHRNTVVAAYAELAAQGYLSTNEAQASFISETLPEFPALPKHGRPRPSEPGFATHSATLPDSDDDATETPGTLRLDGGVPDLRLMPTRELAQALRRVLLTKPSAALAYQSPGAGPLELRVALAEMLRSRRALNMDETELVITRGSQMALWLVAQNLIRRGDRVAVEAIGYVPARRVFEQHGAQLVPIAVDAEGMNVEMLFEAAKKARIRAVYVTPHHQYPTQVTLSQSRRLRLLEFAQRERVAVIEDDYDHEFHYEGRPILPMASLDSSGQVIYIGTLSKLLAPGLRIGYLCTTRTWARTLAHSRFLIDRQGDSMLELAVSELFADGSVERYARRARDHYHLRRDTFATALKRELGAALNFDVPRGGMALWAEVIGVDVAEWARRAAALGVVFSVGQSYHFEQRKLPFARLGYARSNEAELTRAVHLLGKAYRAAKRTM